MRYFKVEWIIELHSEDERSAAEQALHYITEGDAKVFFVTEIGEVTGQEIEKAKTIDLCENEED